MLAFAIEDLPSFGFESATVVTEALELLDQLQAERRRLSAREQLAGHVSGRVRGIVVRVGNLAQRRSLLHGENELVQVIERLGQEAQSQNVGQWLQESRYKPKQVSKHLIEERSEVAVSRRVHHGCMRFERLIELEHLRLDDGLQRALVQRDHELRERLPVCARIHAAAAD